jgi:hypothetical protein
MTPAKAHVDIWLTIILYLYSGTLLIDLNNPFACHGATNLLCISTQLRATIMDIFYHHATFSVGAEIFLPHQSLVSRIQSTTKRLLCSSSLVTPAIKYSPHLTLRPSCLRRMQRLAIPGRLVHAFCRASFAKQSIARYMKALRVLDVEFDAGEWKRGMGDKNTVEEKVKYMFVEKPDFLVWFFAKKQYSVNLLLRFPVKEGECSGLVINGEGLQFERVNTAVGGLWREALVAAFGAVGVFQRS